MSFLVRAESKEAKDLSPRGELPVGVSKFDLKRANTIELRSLMYMIQHELNRREHAIPYVIEEIKHDKKHFVVHQAVLIEDDEGNPRYMKDNKHSSITVSVSDHSVLHQDPHVGNVFEMIILEGYVVDFALRVATHL